MFGLSFGAKKQSGSTNSTLTKDESTVQNTTAAKTGTQSTNSATSGTSASQGTSTTAQTQDSVNQQQTGSATESVSKAFSDQTLSGLDSLVQQLLGSSGQSGSVVNSAVGALQGFDPNAFVNSSVTSAQARTQSDLDRTLGGLSDRIGSAEGNNSMATLLANRARNDAAASVEGVRASATAAAEGIQRENLSAAVGASQSQNSFLGNLLSALKGGQQSQTAVGTESVQGAQSSATAGSTATSEATQQASQSSEMQNLTEILNQLLTGNTTSVGTENTKTKGTTFGGGLSLSL